jgi:hypothetical protein
MGSGLLSVADIAVVTPSRDGWWEQTPDQQIMSRVGLVIISGVTR